MSAFSPFGKPIKILLIEDNPGDVRLFQNEIEKTGNHWYELKSSQDLQSAPQQFIESGPDLILLDLSLPDSFGIKTISNAQKILKDIPIIVLTGLDDEEIGFEAIKNGAQDFLCKGDLDSQTIKKSIWYSLERHRARQKLEQSNRDLESFASVASHDLKEPLRKVISFGDRLLEKYYDKIDEQGQDYLNRMIKATERMHDFIDSLLEFSKSAKSSNAFEKIDLNHILDEVLSDLDERIMQTKGEVTVEPLPTITANKLQIYQLFQNLISNALKFQNPEATPSINISANQLSENFWEISVRDNGIGFDQKYLDKIFNPFERLHDKNKFEGSGMGLAICRKIVERHGGNLTAISEPEKGATFHIIIPNTPPKQN